LARNCATLTRTTGIHSGKTWRFGSFGMTALGVHIGRKQTQ